MKLRSRKNPFLSYTKRNGDPRYQTKEWKKKSAVFRKRNPICANCKSTDNLTVDHILPISKYPELFWEQSNWRTLCNMCNASKKDKIV